MPNKYQFLVLSVLCVAAFAIGRFSASTQKSVVSQENTEKQQVKDVETQRTTVTVKSPNGEVKTTTTVNTVDKTKTNVETTKSAEVQISSSKFLVSAMAGYNFKSPDLPLYGVSISRKFLGPVTTGIWGLNNGTIGLSVGVEF